MKTLGTRTAWFWVLGLILGFNPRTRMTTERYAGVRPSPPACRVRPSLPACRARPPLPCRASPPQVGRSQAAQPSRLANAMQLSNDQDFGKPVRPADLPPCGGDARQGRGGYHPARHKVPRKRPPTQRRRRPDASRRRILRRPGGPAAPSPIRRRKGLSPPAVSPKSWCQPGF
jgi:hypothetical protein